MAAGETEAALALFTAMAARHAGREILSGIAVCALALGRVDQAREAVARALSIAVPDVTIARLAARLAPGAWCGMSLDGALQGDIPADAVFTADREPPQTKEAWVERGLGGSAHAPPDSAQAPQTPRHFLTVTCGGQEVLGSPIDLRAIGATDGFVSLVPGGIAGWAWHPADPSADPTLTILQDNTARTIRPTDLSITFRGTTPLARPRGFRLNMSQASQIRVLGADGRDILGSPLGGPTRAKPAPPAKPHPGTAIVVPVYRGRETTLACLESVRATIGPHDRLIVVNDSSPDPALTDALQALAREGAITLIPSDPREPGRNLGFPGAANAGLLHADGADAVLLNSDTVVYPGWLQTLRTALYSAPDIGTATPLSNDATIFTYPDPANPSPMPTPEQGAAIAAQALSANAGVLVDVPTGHGFCLYIRAACLAETGLFRGTLFAQGYGEENDFCERARKRGWRHVAVPSVYVGHVGGVSFGAARHQLLTRNGAILDRLHPSYRGRVDAFIRADPLLPARRRLDTARFVDRADRPAVLLVSHAGHGGTTRIVRERAAACRAEGLRPITLRGHDGFTDVADEAEDTANLSFFLPQEQADLLDLLRRCRPVRAEIHHLSGHGHALLAILHALALPFDLYVHDYQWLCARMTLVTGEGKFCGEAPTQICRACVAQWGDAQEVPLSPDDLRARSAALLPQAEAVVAPSADVGRRISRHFPRARLRVQGWEPDPPAHAARLAGGAGLDILTVAVVGAIGMEKGYDVLLACARDAADRGLKLRFGVAGFTRDDTPLLATGRVFVTGPFKPGEARATIASLGARLAFLPSVWPETWCFALTDAWDAGLDAAVFDIGTPAERVRRTGRGWVWPLGLPPSRVNDALLNLQGAASRS
jgi:GT2 family glycosyltransferase/glycosyltransferase involved in cell wall biosynthesis